MWSKKEPEQNQISIQNPIESDVDYFKRLENEARTAQKKLDDYKNGLQAKAIVQVLDLISLNKISIKKLFSQSEIKAGVEVVKPKVVKYRKGDLTWSGKGKRPAWAIGLSKEQLDAMKA